MTTLTVCKALVGSVSPRVADGLELVDAKCLLAALLGVDRLPLVSSSQAGQRVTHHDNVIRAAKAAQASRVVYTSMLNADDTTNPLAGERQDTETALNDGELPFTVRCCGWYTENYTDQIGKYLNTGEIVGAAMGRTSAATRPEYAATTASALLDDEAGSRTDEVSGPAFDFVGHARVTTEVTGTPVTYRELPAQDFLYSLRGAGLDEASADLVAALNISITLGDLDTETDDLICWGTRHVHSRRACVSHDRLISTPESRDSPFVRTPRPAWPRTGSVTDKEESVNDNPDHHPDRSPARAHEERR